MEGVERVDATNFDHDGDSLRPEIKKQLRKKMMDVFKGTVLLESLDDEEYSELISFLNTEHVQKVCTGTIIGRQKDRVLPWSEQQAAIVHGQSHLTELSEIATKEHPVVHLTNLWVLELSTRDTLSSFLQSAEERVESAMAGMAEITEAQEALVRAKQQSIQSQHWCDRMCNVLGNLLNKVMK